MADNRFKNDEFEDIFSNSSSEDTFEDVYSSSTDEIAETNSLDEENNIDEYFNEDYTIKYNSAVQNRRRQEIQYEDIDDVYGQTAPDSNRRQRNAKNKKSKAKKTVLAILSIILVLVIGVGIVGYNFADKLLSSFDTEEELVSNEHVSDSLLYNDEKQINVLLVGVDARESGASSRSDTMILVTLDNKNKEIKLTSFLRDSYVEIAGKDRKEKLNAAYVRGGIQTLVDTLEMNFKVSIPYYVIVDFEIFSTIVDELGGINVDVTKQESYYTYHSGAVNVPVRIKAGDDVLLNGEQALWYSRIRYLDSDFMRTQRQRKVISAIVDKASQKELSELVDLAETIIPLVKTNLSSNKIMSMGLNAFSKQAYKYPIVQQQIPADNTWTSKSISGVGSCLVMDFEENTRIIQEFLSEKQFEEVETTTEKE